jgi:hypothetical protein
MQASQQRKLIKRIKKLNETQNILLQATGFIPKGRQHREVRKYISDLYWLPYKESLELMKIIVPELNKTISFKKIGEMLDMSAASVMRYGKYGGGFIGSLKKEVKKRDGDKCRKCKRNDCKLDVHHKGNPQDNSLNNLILLCGSCHQKAHRKLSTSPLAN